MQAWEVGLVVTGFGAVGGILSAVLSEDRGLPWPGWVSASDGTRVWRPGFLGHIVVGAIAALMSWALYGPLANTFVMGGPKSEPGRDDYGITWAALAGAIGVGIGGARWLLNYVDKEILQKAVVKVAGKPSDQQAQIQIMEANPTEAFQIAADMPLDGDQEGSDDVEVPVVTNLGE